MERIPSPEFMRAQYDTDEEADFERERMLAHRQLDESRDNTE